MISLMHLSLVKERSYVRTFFLVALVLPLFFLYFSSSHYQETVQAAKDIHTNCASLQKIAAAQEQNRTIISLFHNKDPLYLQKYVETFTLLSSELQEKDNDVQSSCLPLSKEKKDRRLFLSGSENKLSFFEGKVQQTPHVKETIEVQTKSVEMDSDDLAKVLALLEGTSSSQDEKLFSALQQRPLILTETAELERKKRPDREVWGVKFKLLKREFLQAGEVK